MKMKSFSFLSYSKGRDSTPRPLPPLMQPSNPRLKVLKRLCLQTKCFHQSYQKLWDSYKTRLLGRNCIMEQDDLGSFKGNWRAGFELAPLVCCSASRPSIILGNSAYLKTYSRSIAARHCKEASSNGTRQQPLKKKRESSGRWHIEGSNYHRHQWTWRQPQ